MRVPVIPFLLMTATMVAPVAAATPVLMSAQWGIQACEAWNANPALTGDLMESGWVDNDGGKGHKVLQVYRDDCSEAPTAELRIAPSEGMAKCIQGGAADSADLDTGVDYIMHATTERWREMGAGDYGPMRAMMFGRLKFNGPKWEAMKNMGPFENFLLIVGAVQSDSSACP
jgi:putative sterol carrier protein